MKKLNIILIIGLLLTSCGQNKTKEIQKTSDSIQKATVVPDNLYKIISEKENVNPKFGFNKCNIEVELKEKITKEQLTIIANKIRETRKSYDNLWIFYNLPGKQAGSVAWATTHFTPNLKVEILGSTDAEDKKMDNVSVDGNIIGKWTDKQSYSEHTAIIYEKNNKIYMKSIYSDGSSGEVEYVRKKINGKVRYEPKQNKHNEYYIIEANGNLGMYDPEGKFAEAVKKN